MCKNEYTLSKDGKTAYVKLTQGQVAIIDAEDLEKIGEYRWHASWVSRSEKYYVRSCSKGKRLELQRVIMNPKNNMVVDHINGDSLDNRKNNLRICSQAQNTFNNSVQRRKTDGLKGVYKNGERYVARLHIDGFTKYLGTFDTIEDALSERKRAEKEYYGEFAREYPMVEHIRIEPVYRDYSIIKIYLADYGEVYKVPLTKGEYAIIDIEDYALVVKYKWNAKFNKSNSLYYANTSITIPSTNKRTSITMHRLIMNAGKGVVVDHINGNALDNRRCNLRFATASENSMNRSKTVLNTSGFKGVYKDKSRWLAKIGIGGKRIYLGTFDTPELAYAAYCAAALKYHKEFANFG